MTSWTGWSGCWPHRSEIAAHALERVPFCVDFPLRPHAQTAEEPHRRTPPLHGMLKQQRSHCGGEEIPAPADEAAEREADQGSGRGVRVERTLHIPFAIQVIEPHVNQSRVCRESAGVGFGLPDGAGIEIHIPMIVDLLGRRKSEAGRKRCRHGGLGFGFGWMRWSRLSSSPVSSAPRCFPRHRRGTLYLCVLGPVGFLFPAERNVNHM